MTQGAVGTGWKQQTSQVWPVGDEAACSVWGPVAHLFGPVWFQLQLGWEL